MGILINEPAFKPTLTQPTTYNLLPTTLNLQLHPFLSP